MEIINKGSDNVYELKGLSCCFPPGSLSFEWPGDDVGD
jgi:hypothetical protein